jgi:hypothetical protein
MMTVQFQTKIKNGVIQVPKKYQGKFNNNVRVILRVEGKKALSKNYLDQLMASPIKVKNFQRLAREQVYAR